MQTTPKISQNDYVILIEKNCEVKQKKNNEINERIICLIVVKKCFGESYKTVATELDNKGVFFICAIGIDVGLSQTKFFTVGR